MATTVDLLESAAGDVPLRLTLLTGGNGGKSMAGRSFFGRAWSNDRNNQLISRNATSSKDT